MRHRCTKPPTSIPVERNDEWLARWDSAGRALMRRDPKTFHKMLELCRAYVSLHSDCLESREDFELRMLVIEGMKRPEVN